MIHADTRQLDLFAAGPLFANPRAAPPAPVAASAPDSLAAEVAQFERDLIARQADERAAWEADKAAIAAAEAAHPPEVLLWGKKAGPCSGKYFEVQLLRDGDRWRARSDFSMPNMGGSGPFSRADFASRDEALADVLRKKLASVARHLASDIHSSVNYGTEAEWRSLARWCCDQAPSALFGGADLAAEFEALEATYKAREKLRCAAICAGEKSYIGEDGERRSIYSL